MLPRIGITLGDPAGIGSEITAKLIVYDRITDFCIPIIIGDAKVFQQGLDIIKSDATFEVIHDLDGELESGTNYVYDLNNIPLSDFSFGQISGAAGRAAGESIETAISSRIRSTRNRLT
jgi:4-hydroxythreonine-4-phosphate dehydrogenase